MYTIRLDLQQAGRGLDAIRGLCLDPLLAGRLRPDETAGLGGCLGETRSASTRGEQTRHAWRPGHVRSRLRYRPRKISVDVLVVGYADRIPAWN